MKPINDDSDDPRTPGGMEAIGPKQDDPRTPGGMEAIGPRKDDPRTPGVNAVYWYGLVAVAIVVLVAAVVWIQNWSP
jgi:hypothetical protein